jgi:sulfur-carrier protein
MNLADTRPHLLHLSMSKIHIPTPLRQYVAKQSSVEVKGKTVAEAMDSLLAQHPDLRRHLYTEDGKLRAFVNLYLNDEDIRYLQKEQTALKDGDNISIVPSIAGGAARIMHLIPSTTARCCCRPACCSRR